MLPIYDVSWAHSIFKSSWIMEALSSHDWSRIKCSSKLLSFFFEGEGGKEKRMNKGDLYLDVTYAACVINVLVPYFMCSTCVAPMLSTCVIATSSTMLLYKQLDSCVNASLIWTPALEKEPEEGWHKTPKPKEQQPQTTMNIGMFEREFHVWPFSNCSWF